tara:strand:- start:63534 stop:64253 length:720 start_codon:yes stop_codon:yes gene_type:complete
LKYDFEKYINNFKEIITDSWLTPRGIMFSEAFALYSVINECKSRTILESGTAYGGSTEMLANLFPNLLLTSIDNYKVYPDSEEYVRNRMLKYKNTKLLKGDSYHLLPQILSKPFIKKTAIFIDGPKGKHAGEFAVFLLENFKEKIDFIAVHDVKYDSDVALMYKNTFTDIIPSNLIFTDEPDNYFSPFRRTIDDHMLSINKKKFKPSKSSLDKDKSLGFLQNALEENPRGYGMIIIKPE